MEFCILCGLYLYSSELAADIVSTTSSLSSSVSRCRLLLLASQDPEEPIKLDNSFTSFQNTIPIPIQRIRMTAIHLLLFNDEDLGLGAVTFVLPPVFGEVASSEDILGQSCLSLSLTKPLFKKTSSTHFIGKICVPTGFLSWASSYSYFIPFRKCEDSHEKSSSNSRACTSVARNRKSTCAFSGKSLLLLFSSFHTTLNTPLSPLIYRKTERGGGEV